jgi:iron(III) transport system substrate-binding protein
MGISATKRAVAESFTGGNSRPARTGFIRTFIAAVTIVAAPALHAQSGGYQAAEWAKTVAAANKEGRVVVYYSAVTPVLERVKADFEKLYPAIVVEYSRLNTNVAGKIEAERNTGADGADVDLDSSAILWTLGLAKAGSLKAPSGPASVNWPAAYLLNGAAPVLAVEPIVITYNTNLVKTPITGYQDLLRPEFKGKLATTELLGPTLVAWYEWLEKTQGPDYLKKLAAQAPRYYTGAAATTQAALSGEMSVAAFSNSTISVPLVAQGAPVKMLVPSPSFGIRYTGVVFNWAKRPNAGLVLLDYLMTPRGQAAWHGRGDSASPLPNIPGAMDIKTVTPYDPAPYTNDVVTAYSKKWNAIFKGQ